MSSVVLESVDVSSSMRVHEEQRAEQDEEQNQNKMKKILYYTKNLTWGSRYSSSSSSSSAPCSSNPQNPNPPSSSSLTENEGNKRRAVSQGERKGRVKKAKVQSSPKAVKETPSSPKTVRETPSWLVEKIKDMNGENLMFIFEKKLTTTDVNPSQSRLLIPLKGLVRNDFLTPEELSIIEGYEDKKKNKKNRVEAMVVVNSKTRTWKVSLKTWNMTKSNYALNSGWNTIVKDNELEEGHNIGLWSFRTNGTLCFALVRLT